MAASFALSALNGACGCMLLRAAAHDDSGILLLLVLLTLVVFFVLVSAADLCVKVMGVSWRESVLLVQGNDLGAAVGPLMGYILFHLRLPSWAVLAVQSLVHSISAVVAFSLASSSADDVIAAPSHGFDDECVAPSSYSLETKNSQSPETIGACTQLSKLSEAAQDR